MISSAIHKAFTTFTCPPAPAPTADTSQTPRDTFVATGDPFVDRAMNLHQELFRRQQEFSSLQNRRYQLQGDALCLSRQKPVSVEDFQRQAQQTNSLNNRHQQWQADQQRLVMGGPDSPLWTGSGKVTSQRQLQQEVREGRDLNGDGAIGWPR